MRTIVLPPSQFGAGSSLPVSFLPKRFIPIVNLYEQRVFIQLADDVNTRSGLPEQRHQMIADKFGEGE